MEHLNVCTVEALVTAIIKDKGMKYVVIQCNVDSIPIRLKTDISINYEDLIRVVGTLHSTGVIIADYIDVRLQEEWNPGLRQRVNAVVCER